MASPVSIGDAYLLAKLALKIGHAFTKGRKSAPSQFQDVIHQLYSLSGALDAVSSAYKATDHDQSLIAVDRANLPDKIPSNFAGSQDVLLGILRSCKDTLGHLEKLLSDYSEIEGETTKDDRSFAERWRRELKVNWKKIKWTTEGGDLDTLKTSLIVYTNSLNLILGAIVSHQAGRLENNLNDVSIMLSEIHKWFVDNIKNTAAAATIQPTSPLPPSPGDIRGNSYSDFRCELLEQHQSGPILLCSAASLHPEAWDIGQSASPSEIQFFTCHCPSDQAPRHQDKIASYRLSPRSFPARLADNNRSWVLSVMVNRTTDQLVSLTIRKIPSSSIFDFEEMLIHCLGVLQTRQTYFHTRNTASSEISRLGLQNPRAKILSTIGNAANSPQAVTTVRFIYGKARFQRSSIDSIQILHYRSIGLDYLSQEEAMSLDAFHESTEADILITFSEDSQTLKPGSVTHTILKLRWNTGAELKRDVDTVVIKDISCQGFDAQDTPKTLTTATVELVFTEPAVAASFHRELEAIRTDLFVIQLRYPRDSERTLLKIQANHVYTGRMHIREAEISILQNPDTWVFRLLIRSRRGYSVISQELKADFFQTLAQTGHPDYTAMTYEVYMDDSGKMRLRQCPKGLNYMDFMDAKAEQVFRIGLAATAGSADPVKPNDVMMVN